MLQVMNNSAEGAIDQIVQRAAQGLSTDIDIVEEDTENPEIITDELVRKLQDITGSKPTYPLKAPDYVVRFNIPSDFDVDASLEALSKVLEEVFNGGGFVDTEANRLY